MSANEIKNERLDVIGRRTIVLCGFSSFLLLAYFSAVTVYSSDDYWYSTFWDQGLQHYLTMMDYHYRVFNGRTLVHVLAHIILYFDNWAFSAACCGLFLAAVFAACYGAGVERRRTAAVVSLFLTGVLVMPTSFFTQGVMWITAFCNYVFPAVLICILIVLLDRNRRSYLMLLAAFLCGATTEQMGLAALSVVGIYTIDAMIRKADKGWYPAAVGAAGAGAMTIFLSPATQDRASDQVKLDRLGALLADMQNAVQAESALLTENAAPGILMLAFFILAGIALWRRSGKEWMIPVCGCGAAAVMLVCFGSGSVRLWGFGIVLLMLTIAAMALMAVQERCVGALMLAAVASLVVMLPTNTIFARVMVPFYILVLLSVCLLGVKSFRKDRWDGVLCLVCLAAAVWWLLPAVRGYWHNYQVDQQNKAYVLEDYDSDVLRYCVDYDRTYTWAKPYEDQYFQQKYLESVGMGAQTRLHYISTQGLSEPSVFCNGEQLLLCAVMDGSGRTLMPLREIMEHCGGAVLWSPECITVEYAGAQYFLADGEEHSFRVSWTDPNGAERTEMVQKGSHYGNTYCEMSFFSEIIGLSVQFDETQFGYVIDSGI